MDGIHFFIIKVMYGIPVACVLKCGEKLGFSHVSGGRNTIHFLYLGSISYKLLAKTIDKRKMDSN